MQAWIARQFNADGCLIIDDTGFPKPGERSVGVARQDTGRLGKIASRQVAVTLQLATDRDVVGLDARLDLPEAWTDDPLRCEQAGVPNDVGYAPQWKLALAMLRRAGERGFHGPVLADKPVRHGDGVSRSVDSRRLDLLRGGRFHVENDRG